MGHAVTGCTARRHWDPVAHSSKELRTVCFVLAVSCAGPIAMGRVVMGMQQESSWFGRRETGAARDRPGLFCEPGRLQDHGRRAPLHRVWGSVDSWSVLAAERVSQRSDHLSQAGPVEVTGGRGGRYETVFSTKVKPLGIPTQ